MGFYYFIMKFKELNEEQFISIPKYCNCFVYFLLQDNEVVYVGQTTQGITRPYAHKDKKFDSIKIFYCNKDDLDFYEDMYIVKYKPIYNKQVNYKYNYSFKMVKSLIRKNTKFSDFNIFHLKKYIRILDIKVSNLYSIPTITFSDYEKLYNYIKEV